jgi:hypothetical protein
MKKTLLFFISLLPVFLFAQNYVHNNQGYVDNMLYVKFPDDTGVEIVNKQVNLTVNGNTDLQATINSMGYWTKVHHISSTELTRMRVNAEKNLKKHLPDPNSEFHFHVYNKADLTLAKQLLTDCSLVEKVMEVPIPFNASAPDYEGNEHFITSTNSGIEANDFWTTYSSRGEGIKVCDIEYGFNSSHVDLPAVTIVGPAPQDPFAGDGISHGTAVLGEIASLNNGTGTTGIANGCEVFFAGAYTDSIYDLAAAITFAISALDPGDVILLEQQIAGPHYSGVNQFGLIPVEWYKPYYDAIVLAVGQNIIVVEAAGNGEQDLNDPDYGTGNGAHWPFLPGNESGAIIVGAGAVSTSLGGSDVARSRLWYSNYGYAVDVQGNGEAVTTTGYGDLYSSEGADAYFTAGFSGTSSASPIVTGAVILLQSLYKDTTGIILTPDQMLNLLVATGKPQQSGDYDVSFNIGPLPDVMQAFYSIYAGLGMEENANNHVTMYPNPNPGEFMLSFADGVVPASSIKIYDVAGKEIDHSLVQKSEGLYQVNLSANSTSGMYFVQGTIDGKKMVKKVLISK